MYLYSVSQAQVASSMSSKILQICHGADVNSDCNAFWSTFFKSKTSFVLGCREDNSVN